MNSRELVKASLAFCNEERMPFDLIHSEKPDVILLESDFAQPHPNTRDTDFVSPPTAELQHYVPEFRGELRQDEWGVINGTVPGDLVTQGETVWSPLQDWEHGLDRLRLPDLAAPRRFERAAAVFSQPENADKYRLLSIGNYLYSHLRRLRGFVEASCDIAGDPDMVKVFNERLQPLILDAVRQAGRIGADSIFFAEDLGTQSELLMHPRTWRTLYKPYWAQICAEARRFNMAVFIHSCGNIREIIPDFIEVGESALNLDQQQVFGLDYLANNFGGKITFFNPVDIQRTMPAGIEGVVRAEAESMVEYHRRFKGGMIAKDYYGWNAVSVRDETAQIARDVFRSSCKSK